MTQPGPGEPAPYFRAASPSNPRFAFSSVAGRFILLVFLPLEPGPRDAALATLAALKPSLGDGTCAAFGVLRDPTLFDKARDQGALRWFFDPEGEVSRLYGALDADGQAHPRWILLDPSLRVVTNVPIEAAEAVAREVRALPAPDDHAGVPIHAPVLIVPRVLEPELCRRLIQLYDDDGGERSGVMREVDGRTVGVVDDFKSRSDAFIQDEGVRQALRTRIARRLLPEIERAFQYKVTRIERYIVACYDAEEGGYFRPHRDNSTAGTAHRRFAVSINLNAEEFEGGDLRFPEFGQRTYRPPTGGAVVFSCSLLHEATPVTRGRRYATLPFLYDEAGEELRQKNLHLLGAAKAASEAVAAD